MSMYTNTKKTKKFILVLVLLMLFHFCYPKQVKAFDFGGNISEFFFLVEKGVISFLNNIFCDEQHKFKLTDTKKQDIYFTAENIIKGKFILFDANIFKDISSSVDPNAQKGNAEDTYYDSGFDWLVGKDKAKDTLRNTISGWYYNLRNFAIVALLSVLVYVGIRMVTSVISQDKAKYKIMFKDWLVALCLLVIMHYIMIGILNVTDMITEAIGIDGGGGNQTGYIMSLIENININKENAKEMGETRYIDDTTGKEYTLADAFAYELLLLFIVALTFIFAWKYLKREFTIIFLILLGPISCITYPIDKISDGKAQAFNKWLTEFIYNILVQPFHLLLYLVLCGTAIELSSENILYGLACLAMLIPAEKFVKEMFGFKDKLGGGPLAAMATGAAGTQLLNKIKGGATSKLTGGGNDSGSVPSRLKNRSMDSNLLTDGAADGAAGGLAVHAANENTNELENGNNADDRLNDAQGQQEETRQLTNEVEDAIENNTNEQIGEGGTEPQEDNTDNNSNKRDIKTKITGFGGRLMDAHNQRSTEKWGSAKRKQRWINRGKKAGKLLAKGTVKAVGGLAGASIGAAVGLLSGKGIAAGAVTGAALAGRATNKVTDTVGDYANRMRTPEQREKKALEAFKANKKEIQNARESFMDRYDGVPPKANELDKELEDRFELSMYGLSDEQIDDCIELYQNKNADILEKEALKKGVNVEELKNKAGGPDNLNNAKYRKLLEGAVGKENASKAKQIAGSQAKYTANLAKSYSGKDFRDSNVMSTAYNQIVRGLKDNTNCSYEIADAYAREYLENAAKMKSVRSNEIALPGRSETIRVPVNQRVPIANFLGLASSNLNGTQKERMNNITVMLEEKDFSSTEIQNIAESCADSTITPDGVLEKYEVKVKYITSKKAEQSAKNIIGENATQPQIREETLEMSNLMDDFNLTSKQAEIVRKAEIKAKPETVGVAREIARQNRNKGNVNIDTAELETAKKNLFKDLHEKKGFTKAEANKEVKKLDGITSKLMNGIDNI